MNYLRARLSGWPAQTPPRTYRMVYGPLTIQASSYVIHWKATQQYRDEMVREGEQAFAIVTNLKGEPDEEDGQVVMSLQSFTQLLQWLFTANPEMFVRPMKHEKGTDG